MDNGYVLYGAWAMGMEHTMGRNILFKLASVTSFDLHSCDGLSFILNSCHVSPRIIDVEMVSCTGLIDMFLNDNVII